MLRSRRCRDSHRLASIMIGLNNANSPYTGRRVTTTIKPAMTSGAIIDVTLKNGLAGPVDTNGKAPHTPPTTGVQPGDDLQGAPFPEAGWLAGRPGRPQRAVRNRHLGNRQVRPQRPAIDIEVRHPLRTVEGLSQIRQSGAARVDIDPQIAL